MHILFLEGIKADRDGQGSEYVRLAMTLDLNQIHAIRIEFETYHTGIFLLRFSIHVIDDVRI